MIEKIINIKAKTSLQELLRSKKIDFRYLKTHKLAKKDKLNKNN